MGVISIGSTKLEGVPRWVIAVVGLVIAIGALSVVWLQIRQPEVQLVTLKQANDALQEMINEYTMHIGETPEAQAVLMDDARGRITAQRYVDGCTVLTRTTTGGLRSKLILDLARAEQRASFFALPAVEAAAGQCVTSHPDRPKITYGQRAGCLVEVTGQFGDGCVYVQQFDACKGAFVTEMKWVKCVH